MSSRACSPSPSGTAPPPAAAGAGQGRHQAAGLRRDARRPGVRFGDQGGAGQRARSRGVRRERPPYLAMRFVAGERTFSGGCGKCFQAPGSPARRAIASDAPVLASATADSSRRRAMREHAAADALRAAVRRQLMCDLPLGVFLSGGIDSSGLDGTGGACRGESRSSTFSVGFHERGANELPYARLAADRLGTEPPRCHPDGPQRSWAALPRLLWHEDEPIAFPSSIPLSLRCAPGKRPREGRAHWQGLRRTLPRLQPLPGDALGMRASGNAYWAAVPRAIRFS